MANRIARNKRYYSRHKPAILEQQAQYYSQNKIAVKVRHNRYYEAHKHLWRATHLKKLYNLTIAEYDAMLIAQGHQCVICERDWTEFNRIFAVDHDHKTRRIRALLCNKCNGGLGCFDDNPELLQKAQIYLKEYTNAITS